jgi:NADPH:quinone reductase
MKSAPISPCPTLFGTGSPNLCYAEYIPAAKMGLSQIGPSGAVTLLLMKALVISRLGDPDVLEVRTVLDPVPNSGQELIQVEAGGVNFADIMSAQGGYPGTPKPPLVAGREFCGTRMSDGRRVMGYMQWGAFAEQVAASPELRWPVPVGWSAEEGAAFPVNYFTAYFAYWKAGLLEKSPAPVYVRPPEDLDDLLTDIAKEQSAGSKRPRVLIHAVAGGVGTAAVQVGKLLGLEMYGTSSSEEKLERVKKLGLQHGINYKQRDYEEAIKELTHGEGVDAVFEMLGGEHTAKSVRCLRDFGRVIVYGAATGQPAHLDARILYAKGASVHGLWLTYLSGNRELMKQAWIQLSAWTAD